MDQPNSQEVPGKKVARPPATPGQLLFAVVMLLAICVLPVFHMTDDWLLNTRGVLAKSSDCKVVFEHSGPKSGYDELDAAYVTADGSMHHGSESLVLFYWIANPVQDRPCEVRYSPGWPSRYSTSWGVYRLPSRIVTFVIFLGWAPVLAVGILVHLARGWLRALFRRPA